MKKTALILAALAVAAAVRADDATPVSTPKSSYSVTADFTYSSEYVNRGIKYANNSFQPSVEVSADNAYIGFWTNQPVVKQQDEIDVYAGYKYKVSDALSLEGLFTHYWYPEFKLSNPNNFDRTRGSNEAGIGATYTVAGFSPSVYYYYDFNLHAQTLRGAVGYSVPLPGIGASLDTSVFVGTVTARNWAPYVAANAHESYNYYGADVSLPYRLSENATVTAGVHYAGNDQLGNWANLSRSKSGNLWFSLSLTTGF